jgi:hypothetical protein
MSPQLHCDHDHFVHRFSSEFFVTCDWTCGWNSTVHAFPVAEEGKQSQTCYMIPHPNHLVFVQTISISFKIHSSVEFFQTIGLDFVLSMYDIYLKIYLLSNLYLWDGCICWQHHGISSICRNARSAWPSFYHPGGKELDHNWALQYQLAIQCSPIYLYLFCLGFRLDPNPIHPTVETQ